MASLDRMEGDLVEGAVWLIIGVIIIAGLFAYLGQNSLKNLLESELIRLLNWLKKLLGFKLPSFSGNGTGSFNPSGSGYGPPRAPQTQDPNQLFQIPYEPLANVPGLDSPLYPLANVNIPGGTDFTDPGTGVGVSINGSPYYTGGS